MRLPEAATFGDRHGTMMGREIVAFEIVSVDGGPLCLVRAFATDGKLFSVAMKRGDGTGSPPLGMERQQFAEFVADCLALLEQAAKEE